MATLIPPPTRPTYDRSGLSMRTRCAVQVGAAAAAMSRRVGFAGGMVGGRIALMLHPGCLAELAADRHVALVSGTNGKTTTTAMLAAALGAVGPVASNSTGANMLDGLTAAFAGSPASLVAGEIDEWYLPEAIAQVRPRVVALLNLSRDQLDRSGEIRRLTCRLAEVAALPDPAVFVANRDDPHVVLAVRAAARVVWVAAGSDYSLDRASCPNCGHQLQVEGEGWSCPRCGLLAPPPQWRLTGDCLTAPDGRQILISTAVPGPVNLSNAAIAVVAATLMGVPPDVAADAAASVRNVAGRYATVCHDDHQVRCLLAKNPAGWAAVLDLVAGQDEPMVIAINAAQADGRDTSWLYDVPFERLAGRQVVATGDRAADLGVRLSYAEVAHHTVDDPIRALRLVPAGAVTLVADYTSFHRTQRRLGLPVR